MRDQEKMELASHPEYRAIRILVPNTGTYACWSASTECWYRIPFTPYSQADTAPLIKKLTKTIEKLSNKITKTIETIEKTIERSKNAKTCETTKTKNVENTSKMKPERLGTPFKRRAMENYVGLYSMYAFTSSVARVVVQKTLVNCHNSSKSQKILKNV